MTEAPEREALIAEIEPIKTLKGDHDAYCHVCWEPCYALWTSDEEPPNTCVHGHTKATDCPQAMGRARLAADLAMLRRAGEIR